MARRCTGVGSDWYLVTVCIKLVFCHWDKISDTRNLKEKRFIFDSGFQRFQFMVISIQSRNIMVEGQDGGKLLPSWQPGSRDGKEEPEREEETGDRNTPSQVLPPDPPLRARPHPLTAHSVMKSSVD